MGTEPQASSPEPGGARPARLGDVSSMLRVMRPLHGAGPDDDVDRRRLLADLFRLLGRHAGGSPPPAASAAVTDGVAAKRDGPVSPLPPSTGLDAALPPRQGQTLQLLLNGDSEKQVARRLNLSPHTVHVYVKALYRRFEVSSRAELLARHLKR